MNAKVIYQLLRNQLAMMCLMTYGLEDRRARMTLERQIKETRLLIESETVEKEGE